MDTINRQSTPISRDLCQSRPRESHIRIVLQHAVQRRPGAVRVANRTQTPPEIQADFAQLRVVLERRPPEFQGLFQQAASGLENSQIGGSHSMVGIRLSDLLIELLGGLEIATGLVEISKPRQYVRVVRLLQARLLQEPKGFAGGRHITSERDFAVGQAQIARRGP